ncbi:MAG: sulfurtransferase TusA family protein [Desulfuromonas sp.]|nr:MAG: sulfurtransferase TusA family protein [Desulfuromonas sp.]
MEDNEIIELDIRGQVCPSSLLLTLKQINSHYESVASGQSEVVVKTDNRDATGTIPAAVENMGLVAAVEKQAGYYRITITRSIDD